MATPSIIEDAFRTIRKALIGIDGPPGAALRGQLGFATTASLDKPMIQPMSAAARMSAIIRAGELLRNSLVGFSKAEPAAILARYSSLVGDPPSSPRVAAEIARTVKDLDVQDITALVKAFELVQGRDWSSWCAYEIWNGSIVSEFLAGSRAGRPVYLDVEPSTLERLGAAIGAPLEIVPENATKAFVASVLRTLSLRNDGPPLLEKHVQAARAWSASIRRDGGDAAMDQPPFVGALALMSFAAEQMRTGDGMRQTNYYGRLCEILDVPPDARSKVESDFRKHSHQLWGHLNAWLHAAHGARGIPTAEAFDYRVHVGLPISQALVRAADRDRLPEFFVAYQFSPYQQFSRADMRDVLAGWLPGSSVGGTLKAAWNSGAEAQRRIADVVCIELEHWDGAPPETSALGLRREFQARVVATYYQVPVPEFTASIGVLNEDQVPVGRYRFADGVVPVGLRSQITATREYGGFLRLDAEQNDLGDDALIPVALRTALRLHHDTRFISVSRLARPVVVMLMDESRDLFVEAARAELGRDHLVLVRDDLVADARAALELIARPGFGTVADIRGIPPGWTLFHDVQIRRLLDMGGPLEPLTPRSRAQVEFVGGMKLSDGRWHSVSPPTILAIDGTGRDFSLSLFDESGADPESSETVLGTYAGEALVGLDGTSLSDGNYRIVLNEVMSGGRIGAHLTSRALKLRSADSSHLDPSDRTVVGHCADLTFGAWAALSAASIESQSALVLRGASFESSSVLDAIQAPAITLPPAFTSTPVKDVEELFGRLPTADRRSLEEAFEQLLQQGLVVVEESRPRITEAGERWWEARTAGAVHTMRRSTSSPATEIVERFEADMDLILDAAVAVGGGTWSTLEQLIRYSSRERWEPTEGVRNLAALGYLDLELDPRSLRVRRWSVCPPTLVIASGEQGAFLAGARTRRLIDSIEREASERGGSIERIVRGGRPATLWIRGVASARLHELARFLGIKAMEGSPLRIAERLPSIRDIYRERPELRVPRDAAIKVFDFDANAWRDTDEMRLAGAYRVEADLVRFGVLADDGLRECDNSVAKYAAAAATGRHILAYDSSQATLICLLGARPPGLFERAIVLSTGDLPKPLSNGTSVYEGITPELARWLAHSLGPDAWRA